MLSLINAVIRPVLMLALPLRFMTFGLAGLSSTPCSSSSSADWASRVRGSPGHPSDTFLAALFGSVVMGIVSGILNAFIKVK